MAHKLQNLGIPSIMKVLIPLALIVIIHEYAEAQTVKVFRSRQEWLGALTNDAREWLVDFTTNLNRDFSSGVSVTVSDTANVARFNLKAVGPRVDENVISATEDAAVMFVERGSLGDRTIVELDLVSTPPTRAWGASVSLGTQKNELVTLELTTTSGPVTATFPITGDGFIGFTVVTGGALTKIRFVATNDDAGAGGEIFVVDNVEGSSSVKITPPAPAPVLAPALAPALAPVLAPVLAPASAPASAPTTGGGCFFSIIPLLGDLICDILEFLF